MHLPEDSLIFHDHFPSYLGVGICTLRAFARVSSDAPVFITALHDWVVSFFSLTLFTNFSSTRKCSMTVLRCGHGLRTGSVDCIANMVYAPTHKQPYEIGGQYSSSDDSDCGIWVDLFGLSHHPAYALSVWELCTIYPT
jgi:hypothetical protein